MTPELTAAHERLTDALRLLDSHAQQETPRVPVPVEVMDLPTSDECEARGDRGDRTFGDRLVVVDPAAGPMLVYAHRWQDREWGWRVYGNYAYPSSGTVHGFNRESLLYPLSDWPELVRMWLAKVTP